MEVNAIGQKQDGGRPLPNRLEPPCFGARVQERDAIAVFSETRDPGAHFESIERRIEIDESLTRPCAIQAAGRPARVRTRPRTWICSRRV